MKHSKEEIMGALKVIMDECASHGDCRNCPLFDDGKGRGTCKLRCGEAPAVWDLFEHEPEIWRAFN